MATLPTPTPCRARPGRHGHRRGPQAARDPAAAAGRRHRHGDAGLAACATTHRRVRRPRRRTDQPAARRLGRTAGLGHLRRRRAGRGGRRRRRPRPRSTSSTKPDDDLLERSGSDDRADAADSSPGRMTPRPAGSARPQRQRRCRTGQDRTGQEARGRQGRAGQGAPEGAPAKKAAAAAERRQEGPGQERRPPTPDAAKKAAAKKAPAQRAAGRRRAERAEPTDRPNPSVLAAEIAQAHPGETQPGAGE